MRLRHIEVFHAVMRTGSLSRAAELLSVSQPAVSKVLAHAERSLGLKLFMRAHGRLAPTREAELLFTETQKLQSNLDGIRGLARNLALQPQGLVRIGCLPSLGFSLIPRAVEAFRASYPAVSLKIQTRHTDELLNALLTRELDLGIALNPPARPGIASAELGRTAIVCVGPARSDDDDAGAREPVALADFVAGDWISLGGVDPLGEAVGNLLEAHAPGGRLPAVEAQTWYVARALAARGVGRVLLDELTARCPGEPVEIYPIAAEFSVGVFAAWREGGMDSHAVHAFAGTLKSLFAPTPDRAA